MGEIISLKDRQPAKLSRKEFKDRLIELVESGCVKVTRHLNRDHPDRRISQAQIEMCLLKGTVQTNPFVNQHGNWQSEVFRHMAGQELTVVAAIEWAEQVIVITAYEP